jgi:hypothetical protein
LSAAAAAVLTDSAAPPSPFAAVSADMLRQMLVKEAAIIPFSIVNKPLSHDTLLISRFPHYAGTRLCILIRSV